MITVYDAAEGFKLWVGVQTRWPLRVLPTSKAHVSGILIQPLYATDEETEAQREAGLCSRSHKELVISED